MRVSHLHRAADGVLYAAGVDVGSAVRVRHDVDRRLRGLIDEVRARPGDDHRVDVLARRVGMSARNFARVFRDQVGSTPAAFVTQVRVEAAQRALQLGDSSVNALAEELGFGTPATFRRAFARVTGVTPRAWRARFGGSASGRNVERPDAYASPHRGDP